MSPCMMVANSIQHESCASHMTPKRPSIVASRSSPPKPSDLSYPVPQVLLSAAGGPHWRFPVEDRLLCASYGGAVGLSGLSGRLMREMLQRISMGPAKEFHNGGLGLLEVLSPGCCSELGFNAAMASNIKVHSQVNITVGRYQGQSWHP